MEQIRLAVFGRPIRLAVFGLLVAASLASPRHEDFQPQQIHLAIGSAPGSMVVTWVTWSPVASQVEFGTDGFEGVAFGTSSKYIDGGDEHRVMLIHRVTLTDLAPDTRYFYHCGSEDGWSAVYSFKTWPDGTHWPLSLALFGDMGNENAKSLPRLQQEVQRGDYHALIHVGDFAYDMNTDNARVGDAFMRQIQSVAAYLPYMTCPGNHESAYNFSNYRARFSMPDYEETESRFYSWDMGPVHFIAIDTEAYYFTEYGLDTVQRQYQWLVADLEIATTPEARAERPWIILYGHRPMYCSNVDLDDCTRKNCRVRVGLPDTHDYPLEVLLYDYGVDLAIWAHEHSYERIWPLNDFEVLNGSLSEPYTNPRAPVHFTSGSAGCDEHHDWFLPWKPEWSALRRLDYGYTRMQVHNATHLYWEQVSVDKDGEVIDTVWVVKDWHGPYALMP